MCLGGQRPATSARPSTSAISQSGRRRSSRCDRKSPNHSCSSTSPPGLGSVTWPTCAAMSKRGRRSQVGHDRRLARGRKLHPIVRQLMEALLHVPARGRCRRAPRAAGRGQDGAEVHRGAVVGLLEVQEHRVQRAQLLGHRASPSSGADISGDTAGWPPRVPSAPACLPSAEPAPQRLRRGLLALSRRGRGCSPVAFPSAADATRSIGRHLLGA